MNTEKRLFKSNENSVICGVCGGIGEYFGVDPVVIRLAWVVFCCLGGSGIIAYIIAAIIMPKRIESCKYSNMDYAKMKDAYDTTYQDGDK